MKSGICLALLATIILSAQSSWLSAQMLSDDAKQAAQDCNQFAFDLYGRLAASEKGNLFYSPYSIESALAMTYGGAAGNTAKQMAGVLHLGAADNLPKDWPHGAFAQLNNSLNKSGMLGTEKAFELAVSNALWGQQGYPFHPAFLELVKSKYGGGLQQVDFASSPETREAGRQLINGTVAKQTQDKIKDLIPQAALNDLTRLVLTNAVYFKSKWEHTFAKDATKDEDFHLAAGQTVTVPMMHQKARMTYLSNDDLSAIELPYRFGRLSMIVLLPAKADGLSFLEKTLTGQTLDGWLSGFKPRLVDLSLPKFRFESSFSLGDTLAAMGMPDAFALQTADFSGIASVEKMCISGVIHKSYIDVYEEGTEAAAATAVVMMGAGIPRPVEPAVFKADHPFIFLIRHNQSGAILFVGRLMNPKE